MFETDRDWPNAVVISAMLAFEDDPRQGDNADTVEEATWFDVLLKEDDSYHDKAVAVFTDYTKAKAFSQTLAQEMGLPLILWTMGDQRRITD